MTSGSALRASRVRESPCLAQLGRRVQDLALEVRGVDAVVVDDSDPSNACGREVQRSGRAQAARPDQKDVRLEQALLPHDSDLGESAGGGCSAPASRHVEALATPSGSRALARRRFRPPSRPRSRSRASARVGRILSDPRAGGAVRDHGSVRILCDLGQARLDLGHRQVHGARCRRWRAPGRCGRRS